MVKSIIMLYILTFDFSFLGIVIVGCLVSVGFTAEGRNLMGGRAEVNFGGALRCFCFREGEGNLAFRLPGGVCFLIKEENV